MTAIAKPRGRSLLLALAPALALGAGCGAPPVADRSTAADVAPSADPGPLAGAARPSSCPETGPAPDPLPRIQPEHRRLEYWIERSRRYGDPDATILSPAAIADHNLAMLQPRSDSAPLQVDLREPPSERAIAAEVLERLAFLRGRLEDGTYLDARGARLDGEALAPFAERAPPPLLSELRLALEDLPLRCGPRDEGLYTSSLDLAFDRNSCSTIRAQEPLQVLAEWPGGMRLVRTRYALGWIAADASLSPPLASPWIERVLGAERLGLADPSVLRVQGLEVSLGAGAMLPRSERADRVYLGTPAGMAESEPLGEPLASSLVPSHRPLTRRAVLEGAFALLGTPYGWGGGGGGRDCSRFLLDIFESFDLRLPRHSGRQAMAGSFSLDVGGVENLEEKLRILETAARQGIVLLHFPGHIMLYLGLAEDGRPMAIHAFSEYVEPCEGQGGAAPAFETLRRVDRVEVSDLRLGEGSSRRSFLERLSRIVVLAEQPGDALRGAASLRPAAPVRVPDEAHCDDTTEVAIFRSPHRPFPGQPLRVIVTSAEDPGPVELTLLGPDGDRVPATVHRLGGPPFSYWAEVERPAAGRWTAILGDGSRVEACERFYVVRYAPEPAPRASGAPTWEPSWSWEADTENLFAAFVEQLFRDPVDGDITWPSLQAILRDPARNLLHNHRSLGEDEALELQPDCADLPYFLRMVFAWKLRLPFAFRQCNRGREGRPPSCGELQTNADPIEAADELEAMASFSRRVGRGVHSASARTVPRDDASDSYPIPLSREALRPGTVFADPYGHLLVIAAWIPQGIDHYGVLIGADAQPDGTVGRRRFWRGSFLFTPETRDVGAGFKAWRPIVLDEETGTLGSLDNATLRRSRDHTPYSEEQYEGDADSFYERMEALINPRPLDPVAVQVALVDALEEGVTRRIVSVDNGERYVAEHPGRSIEMPEGLAIFQTSGPWEDFSTPSRDMRLLISLDAVLRFPETVERDPARFGLEGARIAPTLAAVRARLQAELEARSFEYIRSDGSAQTLRLAQIVERRLGFEMAYNPNDCVELRWAAPEGSPERSTCRRHAPAAQRRRMLEMRGWFHTRQRPAR